MRTLAYLQDTSSAFHCLLVAVLGPLAGSSEKYMASAVT